MKNKLSMNVVAVAKHLKKLGVPVLAVHVSDDIECEDDSIEVSKTIHVQVSSVGDAYMSVSRQTTDGDFLFYPERLDVQLIALDIRKAMTEERIGL